MATNAITWHRADSGLVVSVHTYAANVHDSQCVAACLDQVKLASGSRLLADKGYASSKNRELLRAFGVVSSIKLAKTSLYLYGSSVTTN